MVSYEAPSGTKVYWAEAEVRQLKNPTTINPSVQWDGNDGRAYCDRYAEGDFSSNRVGSYIVSFGVEQQGGPAHDEVKKWLAERGERREPTKQEIVDWSIVHYGNSAPPIAKPDGTKVNPIPVKDARYPHGHVLEVGGKWYMNDLSAGSKATKGFPAAGGKKGDTRPEPEPDYKAVVAKVRARVQAVDLPSGGGKPAIQLRQLVNDLSSIVGTAGQI